MKRRALLLAFGLLAAAIASARADSPLRSAPLGYCALTVSNAAVSLSGCAGGVPAGANNILVVAEGNAVRWRDDGVAPTASVGGGNPLAVSVYWDYAGALAALQFIAQTGTATVNVNFYR